MANYKFEINLLIPNKTCIPGIPGTPGKDGNPGEKGSPGIHKDIDKES